MSACLYFILKGLKVVSFQIYSQRPSPGVLSFGGAEGPDVCILTQRLLSLVKAQAWPLAPTIDNDLSTCNIPVSHLTYGASIQVWRRSPSIRYPFLNKWLACPIVGYFGKRCVPEQPSTTSSDCRPQLAFLLQSSFVLYLYSAYRSYAEGTDEGVGDNHFHHLMCLC